MRHFTFLRCRAKIKTIYENTKDIVIYVETHTAANLSKDKEGSGGSGGGSGGGGGGGSAAGLSICALLLATLASSSLAC